MISPHFEYPGKLLRKVEFTVKRIVKYRAKSRYISVRRGDFSLSFTEHVVDWPDLLNYEDT